MPIRPSAPANHQSVAGLAHGVWERPRPRPVAARATCEATTPAAPEPVAVTTTAPPGLVECNTCEGATATVVRCSAGRPVKGAYDALTCPVPTAAMVMSVASCDAPPVTLGQTRVTVLTGATPGCGGRPACATWRSTVAMATSATSAHSAATNLAA